MFENVNQIAVLVAALVAMAVGSVWYSPLLFGEQWMHTVGLTEDDLRNAKGKMPKLFLFAALSNLLALYILAQFVALAQSAGAELATVAFFLSLFLTAIISGFVIWEQKSLTYALINIGYAVVVVFGGMSIIWYWPW